MDAHDSSLRFEARDTMMREAMNRDTVNRDAVMRNSLWQSLAVAAPARQAASRHAFSKLYNDFPQLRVGLDAGLGREQLRSGTRGYSPRAPLFQARN
jgi:hypothetical protein